MNAVNVNLSRPERWVTAAGGSALFVYGLRRRDPLGFGLAALGATVFYRAAKGFSGLYEALDTSQRSPLDVISVQRAVTVDRQPDEAFAFWRNFENATRFMDSVESVVVHDDRHSHWVIKGPLGRRIEWDTEIVRETKGRLIEWRSVNAEGDETSGSARFSRRQNGRGTKVHFSFRYVPPANGLGTAIAKLFAIAPEKQLEQDLHKFKQAVESR